MIDTSGTWRAYGCLDACVKFSSKHSAPSRPCLCRLCISSPSLYSRDEVDLICSLFIRPLFIWLLLSYYYYPLNHITPPHTTAHHCTPTHSRSSGRSGKRWARRQNWPCLDTCGRRVRGQRSCLSWAARSLFPRLGGEVCGCSIVTLVRHSTNDCALFCTKCPCLCASMIVLYILYVWYLFQGSEECSAVAAVVLILGLRGVHCGRSSGKTYGELLALERAGDVKCSHDRGGWLVWVDTALAFEACCSWRMVCCLPTPVEAVVGAGAVGHLWGACAGCV